LGIKENTVWSSFEVPYISEVTVDEPELIIIDVLNTFGVPHDIKTSSFILKAGKLDNIDLKRIDPVSAIKASLLEIYAFGGDLTEFAIDSDGEAYIYTVGEGGSNSDISPYYSVKSHAFTPKVGGVMVTGRKPMQERITDSPEVHIIGGDAINYTIFDATHLDSACVVGGFTTHACITYNDPIGTANTSYNNGIKDVTELGPNDTIEGWIWYINPGNNVSSTVNIAQQAQASVPIFIDKDGVGKLPTEEATLFTIGASGHNNSPPVGIPIDRKQSTAIPGGSYDVCNTFDETDAEVGSTCLPLTLPMVEGLTYVNHRGIETSKLLNISGVYCLAVDLTVCAGRPKVHTAGLENPNKPENTQLCISAQNAAPAIYKFEPAKDFLIVYPTDDSVGLEDYDIRKQTPCLQFARNCRPNDLAVFGTDVPFYVDKDSQVLVELFSESPVPPPGNTPLAGYGTVLPKNNDGTGLLLKQLWVQVDLETPCFVITDPRGKAIESARSLEVSVKPIIVRELPQPVAINGVLINREFDKVDSDPTTTQDFEETDFERAMAQMSSGRTLNVSLSSLGEEEVETLSKNLYDLMSSDIGFSYSHICGPTETPSLGSTGPNGGIINSIEYNYSDSGSYLITVNEGPKFFGDFSGLDGGFYTKKVEDINAKGTVIQDYGNHIDFKIRVDGIGNILAINCCSEIIAVNDRVSVTIHNNEVEG
jgi:hypothetical protein